MKNYDILTINEVFVMENLQPDIRNAVRAVIIRQQEVLLLKKIDDKENVRYALPGGAQEAGETLEQALIRECQEEIGCTIEHQDILYVADFFKYKSLPQAHTRHQLEILFQCRVPDTYIPLNGSKPDKHQVDVVWVNLQELPMLTIFPVEITDLLLKANEHGQVVYAGKID